jgi:hypothetical protein
MIHPIAALALAKALRDERRPPPLRRARGARNPLRARLAGVLGPRPKQPVSSTESEALS